MRQFYTPYGWEGSKYKDTHEKLNLKEIAKKIKDEILSKYPEISVSVKTQHFSGGQAININIISYPKPYLQKILSPHFTFKFQNLEESQIPEWAYDYAYTSEAKALIDDIQRIANQYRYDDSDSQIDYFSTNFYCTPEFDWTLREKELKRLGAI